MSELKYLQLMQKMNEALLYYLDNEDNADKNFLAIKKIFDDYKICEDKYEFKSILQLIHNISQNHHRYSNFFSKIDTILKNYKNEIKKSFSNQEIFDIFKKNKRILLTHITEQIMKIDDDMIYFITNYKYRNMNYLEYLAPEIKQAHESKQIKHNYIIERFYQLDFNQELPDNFEENRRKGENHNYICEVIRNDSIDDFIIYINQNNYPLNSMIEESIYETNNFLLKRKNQFYLIDYAVFFGSVQIFNYLYEHNNIKFIDSIMFYAIHSNNAEMIQIIDEANNNNNYNYSDHLLIKESIKCHHNDFANFFLDRLYSKSNYQPQDETPYNEAVLGFKYLNFAFLKQESINQYLFYYLCKKECYPLIYYSLMNGVNVNHQPTIKNVILIQSFLNKILILFFK